MQLYMSNRHPESITLLNSLLEIATTNNDTELFVCASNNLGGNYIALAQYPEAKAIASLAITKYKAVRSRTSTPIPGNQISLYPLASLNSNTNTNSTPNEDEDDVLLSLHEILGLADLSLGHPLASLTSAELVFHGRVKVYGEKHTHTLHAMGNLAAALEGCGEWERAWDVHERLVGLWRGGLGDEHKGTRRAVGIAAGFYERLCGGGDGGGGSSGSSGNHCGDLKKGEKMGRKTLDGQKGREMRRKALKYRVLVFEGMCRDFGNEDTNTLIYMRGLSKECSECGEVERGVEVQERLVEILERGVEMGKWEESEWIVMQRKELRRMRKVVGLRRVVGWCVRKRGPRNVRLGES